MLIGPAKAAEIEREYERQRIRQHRNVYSPRPQSVYSVDELGITETWLDQLDAPRTH